MATTTIEAVTAADVERFEGEECARRETAEWLPCEARAYLEECRAHSSALVEGRSDFDRGYMSVVRALAERP